MAESGFTHVEVLTVSSILAVLTVMFVGMGGMLMKKGALAKETSAAKTLITAYSNYAAENGGAYMPGMDATVNEIWFEPEKKLIKTLHVPNRYPYRLAQYFGYKIDGIILVNENQKQMNRQYPPGSSMRPYMISTFPAFGINYQFVGGDISAAGKVRYEESDECLRRQGQSDKSFLVFATASSKSGNDGFDGFSILTPPNLYERQWSIYEWTKDELAGNYGNVHARYDGNAICAFTDGSVRMKSIEELRDMTLWSKNAADLNQRDYKIPRPL